MADHATKRCRECGGVKPLSGFYRRATARDGYRSECKDCRRARSRLNYRDNYAAAVESRRRYQADRRERVFAHYGTVCVCCGATDRLSIDHLGDGQRHREELFGISQGRASSGFYHWLVMNGFPPGYQVLCRPCNSSKGKTERCRLDHTEQA